MAPIILISDTQRVLDGNDCPPLGENYWPYRADRAITVCRS